jgi:hypothetical protein
LILDKELIFSTAQEVKSGENNSSYIVDLGAGGDAYDALWFVVQVDTAAAAGESADPTLNIKLQTSADNASYTSLYETGDLGTDSLTAGTEYKIRIPVGVQRYLKVVYEVTADNGANFTAGKYTAFLTPDIQTN